MGDGLVHVEEGQEHLEAWVALLKAPHVLVQHRRKPLLVAVGTHIALVTHLQDDLMERLFLFARAYLLVVVLNLAVCPDLLGVVSLQSLVKEFMVHCLDISSK